MKLAILAFGFALGAASVLWLLGRSMVTSEPRRPLVDNLIRRGVPPDDPYLRQLADILERAGL